MKLEKNSIDFLYKNGHETTLDSSIRAMKPFFCISYIPYVPQTSSKKNQKKMNAPQTSSQKNQKNGMPLKQDQQKIKNMS